MSKVSVSRRASLPHDGHLVNFQEGWFSKGLPAFSKSTFSGNKTGKSSSGTGTMPQSSQCIIGIGHPQYLCLETPQSLRRYVVFLLPAPLASKAAITAFFASSISRPSRKPELIMQPGPV